MRHDVPGHRARLVASPACVVASVPILVAREWRALVRDPPGRGEKKKVVDDTTTTTEPVAKEDDLGTEEDSMLMLILMILMTTSTGRVVVVRVVVAVIVGVVIVAGVASCDDCYLARFGVLSLWSCHLLFWIGAWGRPRVPGSPQGVAPSPYRVTTVCAQLH